MGTLAEGNGQTMAILNIALTEIRSQAGEFDVAVDQEDGRYRLRIEDDRGWRVELSFSRLHVPPEDVIARVRQALALRSWDAGAPRAASRAPVPAR